MLSREQFRIIRQRPEKQKRALKTVKGQFVWQMAVASTKVPLFKDPFWHFQIKIKFQRKIMR